MTDVDVYSSPLSLIDDTAVSNDYEQFGTPIDNDEPSLLVTGDTVKQVGVDELLEGYTPDGYDTCQPCPNIFKSSFHVLLASVIALVIPSNVLQDMFSKVPYIGNFDIVFYRALVVVLVHFIISRFIGKLF